MTLNEHSLATRDKAEAIEAEYQLVDGIYLLGSVARGLTVFDQQVRAHNLAWALWRLFEVETPGQTAEIAVVGGGIAGLTLTACLLARAEGFKVTLFEQRWDLCPLQQGSDTRWVHPHIYRWPEHGSRAPDAGLPVLNWAEGRASDVSREVLDGFGRYAEEFGDPRLEIFLGLSHLKVDANEKGIEWMGRIGERCGSHVRAGDADGDRRVFDIVVLATGFGLEEGVAVAAGATSYWRNDRLGQPELAGGRKTYVISGFGDGALIDLCRLTIERFRQDTILHEIFATDLEPLEDCLRNLLGDDLGRTTCNVHDLLTHDLPAAYRSCIDGAVKLLRQRLRKDTHVVLHARGRGEITSLRDLFDDHSSFLNRTMLYLLYRCGAFVLSLETLESTVAEFRVPPDAVVKRHGAKTAEGLLALFSEPSSIEVKLDKMKTDRLQAARRAWPLGAFPNLTALSR